MSRKLAALSFLVSLTGGVALADIPKVAADIAPVHALVARVMEGVGTPSLILSSGASPHEYSLRPSEARALQEADIVFWIGPDLTPWLDETLDTLAGDATAVRLMQVEGTTALPRRESALFEAHRHADSDHAHEHATAHESDAHADHDNHDTHGEHDDHEPHAGHGEHETGGKDPHAWLSPDNGAVWLTAIASTLSDVDPANAELYAVNAADGQAELEALKGEIEAMLSPLRDRNFIVFHDAFQYFEHAFEIPAAGAISLSDATEPSPARIAEIRGRVADQNVTCVLAEPQFNPGIVAAVMERSSARTGTLDPLGSDLAPGAGLYPMLLRNLAVSLADCL
ncbi:zinc ABC transporter substrate-binding protein [Roseovarius aestuariivivens]|uniref:zinc ABC transporter substrate-binding protein n=1 Tax=Roseovarius aestuariivivens TaxID=1888910 RepID=UPI001081F16F|nr:zinc ABC transporter substrate-binding protein [Roseovarius aestuariivivens]